MSHENLETVRKLVDAFNAFARDELSSEALAQLVDPQIELHWHDQRTYPDTPQHLRGAAAFITFCQQYRAGWDELVAELLELIQAPDGRVVGFTRQSSRGRQSGVPVVIHFFQLWTIRDGKFSKIEYFRHRADALEAAGLSE
jgi:ketosteroid isomerase-like protein